MKSKKIFGILLLLIYVCVATAMLNDNFIKPFNLQNMLRSSSMFAIIGIGAVFVIVTGGIDLSIGSLIGLVGCTMTLTTRAWLEHPPAENGSFLFRLVAMELMLIAVGMVVWNRFRKGSAQINMRTLAWIGAGSALMFLVSVWVRQQDLSAWATVASAVIAALLLSLHIGWLHGILITKLRLQPFIVTLCGLMCYRGLTRFFADDKTQGLGTEYNDSLRLLATGRPCTITFVLMVGAAVVVVAGIWKLISGIRNNRDRPAVVNGLTAIVCGLFLFAVTSSRYWDGWETEYGNTLCTVGPTEFRFFELTIDPVAVERPARLMEYSWLPMAGFLLALGAMNIRRRLGLAGSGTNNAGSWLGLLLPFAVVVAAAVGLFLTQRWIAGEAISVPRIMPWKSGADLVVWGKIGSVFGLMAVVMLGVVRMGKSWTKETGCEGRALWLGTGFFAVLWLLSHTAINETRVQTPFFFLVAIGFVAAVFLNRTVHGRYLLALGNNEEAARFSGIDIDRMKIIAYVICAGCAGVGGILFTLDSNNVEPSSHGNFYELYAIAAAVLGGCSLRGGEGSVLGVIIGAAIMRVLQNAPNMIGIPMQLELFTMGIVILIGVIADESARRMNARRDKRMGDSAPDMETVP